MTAQLDDPFRRGVTCAPGAPALYGRREFLMGAAAVSALAIGGRRLLRRGTPNRSLTHLVPSKLGPRPRTLSMLSAGNQSDGAGFAKVAPMLKDEMGIDLVVDNLSYDALQQKTFAELATSSPTYQILIVDTPWTPTLTHVLEPLSPYMLSPALNRGIDIDPSDFIPKVFYDTAVYNVDRPSLHYPDPTAPVDPSKIPAHGFEIMGLPIQANALTMAYRKDLFEDPKEKTAFSAKYHRELRPPVTWDEFVQVAEFFTRPSQKLWGSTLMAGVGDWDIDDFKTMVGSFGGDGHLINDAFGVDISTPIALEALQFYVDLIQKYNVTPPGTTSASWDTAGSLFASGVTAMTMNYAPQALSSNVKGSIAYAMVPKKVRFAPHFGTWQLSVPVALDDNTKAWAYRVIAWLTSAKTQKAMLSTELHPTRNSVFVAARASKSIASQFGNFYSILQESLATGVGRARVKDYAQVTYPISVGVNDAARGTASPEKAMSAAAKQVVSVLKSLGYSSAHVD
jgi:multiple sugar transport system substrate-binding protein